MKKEDKILTHAVPKRKQRQSSVLAGLLGFNLTPALSLVIQRESFQAQRGRFWGKRLLAILLPTLARPGRDWALSCTGFKRPGPP